MKKRYITVLIAGALISTHGLATTNLIQSNISSHSMAPLSIGVQITYLGEALSGVSVSVTQDGKSLGSSNTDNNGDAKISVSDYNNRPVTLELKKDGYQTQIMTGMLLKNGSKYEFSMVKGTGTITTEISTGIAKTEDKIQNQIEKSEGNTEKYISETEKAQQ